ncbi:MAG: GNAT family N-acetyltransferase [Roseobacter sp. MedPE-SW]|nr:MAG: GNAT family N-acetyltransferase [Roseobacter sp. MedPE-SW]
MLDFHAPTDIKPPPAAQDTSAPSPGALAQSAEFHRTLTAQGHAPVILPELGNALVTQRRLAIGLPLAMINRATLSAPSSLLKALQANDLGRTPVILSPEHPSPELAEIGALPLVSPAWIARLDLSTDVDHRKEALHQKWRNRLTRAQSNGLRVTRQNMPLDASHWLFAADQSQQRQRRYQSWPVHLTLAYAKENKGKAKLFQAFQGTEPVAAILILRHGRGATYHIAHATERGKSLSAHNLLIWETMAWLTAKGCTQLDLGLINTEEAPGLARFKLGTGARLSQLGGTWVLWPSLGRLFSPLARWDRKLMSAM